jgi:hypothetical protein
MAGPLRQHAGGDALVVPDRDAAVAQVVGVEVRDARLLARARHRLLRPMLGEVGEDRTLGGAVLEGAGGSRWARSGLKNPTFSSLLRSAGRAQWRHPPTGVAQPHTPVHGGPHPAAGVEEKALLSCSDSNEFVSRAVGTASGVPPVSNQ